MREAAQEAQEAMKTHSAPYPRARGKAQRRGGWGRAREPSQVACTGLEKGCHPSAKSELMPGESRRKGACISLRKEHCDPLVMPALGVGGDGGCPFTAAAGFAIWTTNCAWAGAAGGVVVRGRK